MSTTSPQAVPGRSGVAPTRVLLIVGLIAAVVYIVGLWAKSPVIQLITKGIPMLCLIVWLVSVPRDRFANLILVGLIVSLVADLVMEWNAALFLPGLLIFLVVQIIYITAFVGVSKRGSWVRLIPFAIWGVIAFLLLNPYLVDLLLPVSIYIIASVGMMWRATALVGAQGKSRDFEWAVLLGAIALGLSDSLLALNHFVWHDTLTLFNVNEAAPFISTLVIILYWLAQCGFTLAAGWEAKDRAATAVLNRK